MIQNSEFYISTWYQQLPISNDSGHVLDLSVWTLRTLSDGLHRSHTFIYLDVLREIYMLDPKKQISLIFLKSKSFQLIEQYLQHFDIHFILMIVSTLLFASYSLVTIALPVQRFFRNYRFFKSYIISCFNSQKIFFRSSRNSQCYESSVGNWMSSVSWNQNHPVYNQEYFETLPRDFYEGSKNDVYHFGNRCEY